MAGDKLTEAHEALYRAAEWTLVQINEDLRGPLHNALDRVDRVDAARQAREKAKPLEPRFPPGTFELENALEDASAHRRDAERVMAQPSPADDSEEPGTACPKCGAELGWDEAMCTPCWKGPSPAAEGDGGLFGEDAWPVQASDVARARLAAEAPAMWRMIAKWQTAHHECLECGDGDGDNEHTEDCEFLRIAKAIGYR